MGDLPDELERVRAMHNLLRCVCPEPSTPEGHFVNENTVVRLAAMMEWRCLQPKGRCLSADATPAEKTVRVLFLFRNLIVHNGGRFDLAGDRRTPAERDSYHWFADTYSAAKASERCMLGLSADGVITPLIEGCKGYWSERQ